MTTDAAPGLLRLDTLQGRGALAATILGSGMAFLDGTIVNVATKHIGTDFHASFSALQWVLNAYTLTLAALILLGGSLGDRLGRRRVFVVGVIWFATASLACALAPDVGVLIAARAVQGIGGALMTPGSLAIISSVFVAEDRARAVGAWSGLAGVSTALGPLLGGWLVQSFSWRWAFAINLPVAAAVAVLALRYVPETRSAHAPPRLDVSGTVLIALGLGGITFGTTLAGSDGWTAAAAGATALGVLFVGAFLLVERGEREPLVPLGLFRDRTFSGTNLMTFFTYAALGAMFFVLVLNLQVSAGYGALAAGLSMLPMTIVLLLVSARSGALAARIGPRLQLTLGPLVAGGGLLLLSRIDQHHHTYVIDVLPGVLLFALGMATLVAPLTATVMSSAPQDQVGVASGVNNAVARAGGLLAVAVLPTLAGLHGDAYRNITSMVHGYRIVAVSCVGLMLLSTATVALMIRNPTHVPPNTALTPKG
ncbi:MFS transporter [Jatrophihabitans sp.]|uniref:MFS transporter n=1 Tax=Jatrophihabitans sp. TaxID=1932789 RepID=UPI0030C69E6F|nr:drug resistance transporter, EmrB/QacA subfamily [Jatrophihabitans sp.]